MRILVIGATGQIGYALVHALAKTEHQIKVLVRPSSNLSFPKTVEIDRAVEFTDSVFDEVLRQIDCVIYGVGLPEQFSVDSDMFIKVNVGVCRVFLSSLAKTRIKKLIYLSTYEVFSAVDGKIRETHAPQTLDGMSHYFQAMIRAYAMVKNFAVEHEVTLTTIHPAAVYGGVNTGDGVTNLIENLIEWKVLKLPSILPGHFPVIHTDSLAKGIISTFGHQGAFLFSDQMISMNILAKTLRTLTKSYRPILVPKFFAYGFVLVVESLSRLIGVKPILCKVQLDFITNGSEPLTIKAQEVLSWAPMSLAEGLNLYLAYRLQLRKQ